MKNENWVTFPEINNHFPDEIVMGWAGMPVGFDEERLQLNVHVLHRGVIRWGAYEAVTLGAYKGDENVHSYQIGHDAAGNAYSTGTAAISRAEKSRQHSTDDSYRNGLDVRSGRLDIQWNINALNQTVALNDQYDPVVRASQLSSAIKTQAIQAVIRHNTIDILNDRPGASTALYGIADVISAQGVIKAIAAEQHQSALELMGMKALTTVVLVRMLREYALRARGMDVDFRDMITDPFLIAARPSRAAVAAARLATCKLVRPTPLKYL